MRYRNTKNIICALFIASLGLFPCNIHSKLSRGAKAGIALGSAAAAAALAGTTAYMLHRTNATPSDISLESFANLESSSNLPSTLLTAPSYQVTEGDIAREAQLESLEDTFSGGTSNPTGEKYLLSTGVPFGRF